MRLSEKLKMYILVPNRRMVYVRYIVTVVLGFSAMFASFIPAVSADTKEMLDLMAGAWIAHVDAPTTEMSLKRASDGVLNVYLRTNGGSEDFPKIHMPFTEPQDWTKYTRLRARVRFTSSDIGIMEKKRINFVFYDEHTRLTDYPGQPMKQQCLEQFVPVGEWFDLSLPLTGINRQAIRTFDVYLYETPPETPYDGHWEFALLELEGGDGLELQLNANDQRTFANALSFSFGSNLMATCS